MSDLIGNSFIKGNKLEKNKLRHEYLMNRDFLSLFWKVVEIFWKLNELYFHYLIFIVKHFFLFVSSTQQICMIQPTHGVVIFHQRFIRILFTPTRSS